MENKSQSGSKQTQRFTEKRVQCGLMTEKHNCFERQSFLFIEEWSRGVCTLTGLPSPPLPGGPPPPTPSSRSSQVSITMQFPGMVPPPPPSLPLVVQAKWKQRCPSLPLLLPSFVSGATYDMTFCHELLPLSNAGCASASTVLSPLLLLLLLLLRVLVYSEPIAASVSGRQRVWNRRTV